MLSRFHLVPERNGRTDRFVMRDKNRNHFIDVTHEL